MIRYYWIALRGAAVGVWHGLRLALDRRSRFRPLAVRRGVARADLADRMFGPFGDMRADRAITAARLVREQAAADGWTTDVPGVFRRRLQATNTLFCAVDLGLIPQSYLLGLVQPAADA